MCSQAAAPSPQPSSPHSSLPARPCSACPALVAELTEEEEEEEEEEDEQLTEEEGGSDVEGDAGGCWVCCLGLPLLLAWVRSLTCCSCWPCVMQQRQASDHGGGCTPSELSVMQRVECCCVGSAAASCLPPALPVQGTASEARLVRGSIRGLPRPRQPRLLTEGPGAHSAQHGDKPAA